MSFVYALFLFDLLCECLLVNCFIIGRGPENESGIRLVQGEDKGKSRENQAQQAAALLGWKHR